MATALQRKAFRFSKDSHKRFTRALRVAASQVEDLSVPLNDIATRFLISRKFIFDERSGPGAYEDLSHGYKLAKMRMTGSQNPYPILLLTGALRNSIIQRGSGDNITIVRKKSLKIGTAVKYAKYLQEGTSRMPAREFLFWGPESPRFANHSLVKKQNLAMNVTLFNFIQRKLGKTLDASIRKSVKEAKSLL